VFVMKSLITLDKPLKPVYSGEEHNDFGESKGRLDMEPKIKQISIAFSDASNHPSSAPVAPTAGALFFGAGL
jgi:hypothetical protein